MITLFKIEFDGILSSILLKVSVCDFFCWHWPSTSTSFAGADHDAVHRIPGPNLCFIPRIPSWKGHQW